MELLAATTTTAFIQYPASICHQDSFELFKIIARKQQKQVALLHKYGRIEENYVLTEQKRCVTSYTQIMTLAI